MTKNAAPDTRPIQPRTTPAVARPRPGTPCIAVRALLPVAIAIAPSIGPNGKNRTTLRTPTTSTATALLVRRESSGRGGIGGIGGTAAPMDETYREGRAGHLSASRSIPTSPPKRPILLAVDQQFAEVPRLRVRPVGLDRADPLEVGSRRKWSRSARGAGPRPSRQARSGVRGDPASEPKATSSLRPSSTPVVRPPRAGGQVGECVTPAATSTYGMGRDAKRCVS